MNEEQFQIRQLHPTEDPELDPFSCKRPCNSGWICLYKNLFMGFSVVSLELFCKFEIISKHKVKKIQSPTSSCL